MTSLNDTQNLSNVQQKKKFHKLLGDLSLLDNESVDNKERMERTLVVVKEARDLANAAVVNTSAVLLGSYVLRQAGQQALTAAHNIEANTNMYSADELALHVRENPAFWQFALPRQVPSAAFLLGAFEPAPPPQRARAPRRRAEPQRNAALGKPDNIASLEKPQEDNAMVSRLMRWIKHTCRQRGGNPLSYFHCVLHPGSFARTVQNMYYMSFLVRDGMVAVYVDEELGIPMVRPLARAERTERDISQENQFVVSVDMARWKRLIKVFNIKEPMIAD